MPTYLDPLNGITQSAALAESAIGASIEDVRLETLEIWHPSLPRPLRLVVDTENLNATLESDAPRNAGEEVFFQRCRVDIEIPEESDKAAAPEINLRIDNVTGLVSDALRLARTSPDPAVRDAPWELIERVYMTSDTSAPHIRPVFKITLVRVGIQGASAILTAAYKDSVNFSIPAVTFTPRHYPGLLT